MQQPAHQLERLSNMTQCTSIKFCHKSTKLSTTVPGKRQESNAWLRKFTMKVESKRTKRTKSRLETSLSHHVYHTSNCTKMRRISDMREINRVDIKRKIEIDTNCSCQIATTPRLGLTICDFTQL